MSSPEQPKPALLTIADLREAASGKVSEEIKGTIAESTIGISTDSCIIVFFNGGSTEEITSVETQTSAEDCDAMLTLG